MTQFQFCIYMLTIVLSPLIAVQVTEFVNRRREARGRRTWIFRTLMATRISRLSLDHVQALNQIDLEFQDRRFHNVLKAWKAYRHHLNIQDPPSEVWMTKGLDLLVELLFEMGKCLGYSLDKTDIRSTSYSPNAHGQFEDEQANIRRGLLGVLNGTRAIIIQPRTPPSGPDA
jgi:uncharacterized protein DUF6680